MTDPQLFSIIGTVLGSAGAVGISLAVLILRATSRIDRVQSEGAADRRAFQASMDAFRIEMRQLAERTAHLEGRAAGD